MTLSVGLNAMTLLAIWLILTGVSQLGVVYPRWMMIVMGILAILAGLLIVVGM